MGVKANRPPITVAEASGSDLDSISAIDPLAPTSLHRREYLASAVSAGQCYVARIGGRPVGFTVLERSFFEQCFVSLLVTHQEYRRLGVARALLSHVESVCPTRKLFTSTNHSNVTARETFESLGFVRSGWIDNLDEGDPEIVYFKGLR